ncbi:MAG: cysteine--tRNA ligase [bacterium]|nr:cysteine--tRNA ligase [bacterium]
MVLRIYNFLTRKKEVFKPLKKGRVGLYTCGPTVYNYAHIGNLRTYIFEDVLRRTLEYAGFKVKHVMNITDVGHLTSDADTGEDKLEKEASAEKKSVWDVAKFYTDAFLADIELLNIKRADILGPATAHIDDQIKIIKQLFKKGFAYEGDSAIYFDVSKFKKYTKLSRQKLNQKMTGARKEVIVDPGKKHPYDFVLWFKLAGHYKNHTMRWSSPWGDGFPGWHIECSAISTKYLGQPFDIHTGGVDHINVHHTNEIAQSEAAYGKALAKFWMEGEFLLTDKARMAKSEGNFFTLDMLIKKGFNPLAFRYLVLGAHYRTQLNFTWDSLQGAQNALERLREFVLALRHAAPQPQAEVFQDFSQRGGARLSKSPAGDYAGLEKLATKAEEAFFDDLDTPKALAVVWNLVNAYNKSPEKFDADEVLAVLYEFDKVLGLGLKDVKEEKEEKVPEEVIKMLAEREIARKSRDFYSADILRGKIYDLGWEIQDTPEGPRLKSIN